MQDTIKEDVKELKADNHDNRAEIRAIKADLRDIRNTQSQHTQLLNTIIATLGKLEQNNTVGFSAAT